MDLLLLGTTEGIIIPQKRLHFAVIRLMRQDLALPKTTGGELKVISKVSLARGPQVVQRGLSAEDLSCLKPNHVT